MLLNFLPLHLTGVLYNAFLIVQINRKNCNWLDCVFNCKIDFDICHVQIY